MKKLYLLFLVPLLLSTQCESDDEPVLRTEFYIQNDSSSDLLWITDKAEEITIQSKTEQFIAAASDEVVFIKPSENIAFDSVLLFRREENGSFTKVYEQQPIEDELWEFEGFSEYEGVYTLTITNESLVP
jgi:hypothetical protein